VRTSYSGTGDDEPPRPAIFSARRLRQSVQDIVDPPLPLLEVRGIVTEADGTSGGVVMRVGKSRRAPHRSTVNKEVYVRRDDESVRIGMREIQELTMSRLAEVHAIDEEIARRRDRFREAYARFSSAASMGSIPPHSERA
jgi:hypothetical protein